MSAYFVTNGGTLRSCIPKVSCITSIVSGSESPCASFRRDSANLLSDKASPSEPGMCSRTISKSIRGEFFASARILPLLPPSFRTAWKLFCQLRGRRPRCPQTSMSIPQIFENFISAPSSFTWRMRCSRGTVSRFERIPDPCHQVRHVRDDVRIGALRGTARRR